MRFMVSSEASHKVNCRGEPGQHLAELLFAGAKQDPD
jgi:hypothetical protein